MSQVTAEELREVRQDLLDRLDSGLESVLTEMRRGFDGVYQRQDKTNGRLLAAEKALGEHGARHTGSEAEIKHLRREVFGRRAGPPDRRDRPGPVRAITQRDVLVFSGGVGLLWTVLKAAAELAPLLGLPR